MGVYTFRSSDRPVGPTGLSDWSVRRSYRVNASSDRSDEAFTGCLHVPIVCRPVGRSVYTIRSSDRPVGPTGLSDWSVRRSYRVNASSDRSNRRSEESNMFDFVRLPIRLSKRVDTTSDWSVRPRLRSSAYVAAFWRNNKRKLQPCFPDAVFFTTIPKLDDDDTDIADEN